jgi:hypothetical protein
MTRYEIKTIEDFLMVPEDRLDECLHEFKTCLGVVRLAHGTKYFAWHGVFTWVDDGKKDIKVNLKVNK